MKLFSLVALFVGTLSLASAEYKIVLWGDIPYYGDAEDVFSDPLPANCSGLTYGQLYTQLIAGINAAKPKFAMHTGDTKGGKQVCNYFYNKRFEDLSNAIQVPSLVTLGDNDWTDCHRFEDGNYNPLCRLEYIRNRFFTPSKTGKRVRNLMGNTSGAGQIFMTTGAPTYPENQRFVHGKVMYVLVHVPGSNNALYDNIDEECTDSLSEFIDPGCKKANAAHYKRNEAVNAFLAASFLEAKNKKLPALMVVIQADMLYQGYNNETKTPFTGYQSFWNQLTKSAKRFRGETVLVYGDTHRFTITDTKPYGGNFIALEVPGSDDVGYVVATVRPNRSPVFSFQHFDLNPCVDGGL